MKTISIHPFSVLAGAAVLGLVLVATGAVQARTTVQKLPFGLPGLVRVAGIPDPRHMVVVQDGDPFVVPAGKIFVATGLGMNAEGGQLLTLLIDSVPAVILRMEMTSGLPSVRSLAPGLTASAGSVVSVGGGGSSSTRAWGYLVDA